MNRDEFRALTPWSFFLPVALAVALGVLAANALGAALFDNDDADAPAEQAVVATAETGDALTSAGEPRTAPATSGSKTSTVAAATPVLQPVSLPGPTSARRDGETRACIGGTIAVRAENGWEQEVVNNAPGRCVANSN